MNRISRRDFAALAAGAVLAGPACAQSASALITRAIPGSGERLPAVGLGTASVFDNDGAKTRQAAAEVVRTLTEGGGRLIDTASTYGDAETVLGVALDGIREKVFIATKLESPDADELKRSLARLKTTKVDLLQLHNVRDPQQSLAAFKKWKEQGICRYIGITSTFHGDFAAVEAVMKRERPDFVQIDYSLADRMAQQRILPLAAEVKAGVLTAEPLGPALSRGAGQAHSRLGRGLCRELGCVLSQVPHRRRAGDRGHSRHRRSPSHARESHRHARQAARSRAEEAHGGIRGDALVGPAGHGP
jgi:aryl-alcohol dehydrogenase-like predicted oxidoreductase